MMTVTAWETPEDHKQMYNEGTHPEETVQKFLGPELAAGGMTGVWSSGRFTAWVRCSVCMRSCTAGPVTKMESVIRSWRATM